MLEKTKGEHGEGAAKAMEEEFSALAPHSCPSFLAGTPPFLLFLSGHD